MSYKSISLYNRLISGHRLLSVGSSALNMSAPQQPEAPWHAAFPAPKSTAATVSRDEVLPLIKERKAKGPDAPVDFVLVDLRRADHEVRT